MTCRPIQAKPSFVFQLVFHQMTEAEITHNMVTAEVKQTLIYVHEANINLPTVFDKCLFKLNIYPVRGQPWSKPPACSRFLHVGSNQTPHSASWETSMQNSSVTSLLFCSTCTVHHRSLHRGSTGGTSTAHTPHTGRNINHRALCWRKSRPIIRFRGCPARESILRHVQLDDCPRTASRYGDYTE